MSVMEQESVRTRCSFTDEFKRDAVAFARGAPGGVWITSSRLVVKISSNAVTNTVALSRIGNRNRSTLSVMARLRAAWVHQPPVR
jgi:hypothetical protein